MVLQWRGIIIVDYTPGWGIVSYNRTRGGWGAGAVSLFVPDEQADVADESKEGEGRQT
jgi:hypothetical protein